MEIGQLIALLITIALAVSGKKKQKKKAQDRNTADIATKSAGSVKTSGTEESNLTSGISSSIKLRPVAPAAYSTLSDQKPKKTPKELTQPAHGSLVMPSAEPHKHEGKPMPCPAEERVRPADAAKADNVYDNTTKDEKRCRINLSLNKDSLVRAAVMSEVLARPRFVSGRRVIR